MASSGALVGLRLLGGVALLLANGFFVTTEFAMTRVRQFDREEFTGHPGLDRAWEMTERLEIFLSGVRSASPSPASDWAWSQNPR